MSIDFGNDIYEEPIVAKTFLQEDAQEGSLRPKTLREYIGQEKAKDNLCLLYTSTACPTRKAMSAVRFSPTTPRMPSVPNSLPIDITSFVSYDVTVPMGRGFSHADGWADAPPISLLSCQKRNGPCTVQREKR